MSTEYRRHEKQISGAKLLIALILFLFMLSSCYSVMEADHDCSGFACPVCAMMRRCEDHLRSLGTALIGTILVVAAYSLRLIQLAVHPYLCKETLISKKIRMNN